MSFSLADLQEKQRREEQREFECGKKLAVVAGVPLKKKDKKKKKKLSKWDILKMQKEEKAKMERHLARKFLQRSGGVEEDYLNKVGYVTVRAQEVAQDNTLENVRKAKAKLLQEKSTGGGWKKVESAPIVKKRPREIEPSPNQSNAKKKKKRSPRTLPFSKDTAWIEIRGNDESSYYWNTLTDETRKKGDIAEWKYSERGVLLNREEESDDEEDGNSESGSDDSESNSEANSSDENQEKEEEKDKPAVFSFSFKKPTKGGPTAAVFQ